MKFKFYPKESRLYDFLLFPRLVFYIEEYKKNSKDYNFGQLISDDYLDFIRKVEAELLPYKEEIEEFYYMHDYSRYDFIELVFRLNNIFGYKDEISYLDMLEGLEENEIKISIVYSIMSYNEDFQLYSKEVIKHTKNIVSSEEKLISFIKDLPIDSSIKWDLFVVLKSPKDHMNKYVSLMKKIFPIFNQIYISYEGKINEYGKYLTDFLNKHGSKGLSNISYSIIDPKLMEPDKNNILISITGAYNVRIMGSTEKNYIAWGLKIEEAFKQMKEINENKTNERVQIFKNLGDKTRYEVVKLIAAGESSTKVIAEALNVSSATISYHLNNLVTSKIIKLDKYNGKYGYIIDYKLLEDVIWGFKEDLNFPRV